MRRSRRAKGAQRAEPEEAAATLVRLSRALAAHLGAPDLLDRVSRLAVTALGSRWSAMLLGDARRCAFRPVALAGAGARAWRAQLPRIEVTAASFPLLADLRPDRLTEIPDAARHPGLPADVMARWSVTSALLAPIAPRRGLIGVVVHAYAGRRGPFSARERGLALGIAQGAAIALEHARLIAELEAARRVKSEFVAAVSHELRTPLNVITGYTDLLAEGDFGALTAIQQDTLDRIRSNACQLTELINATLDLGRLEAGREQVEVTAVALPALFAELGGELGAMVPAGVSLRWDNRIGERPILTDRAKLKTILKNLVGNALKFTARGAVEVRASAHEPEGIVLTVHDTGIGIAAADLPAIFDAFRQVDGSTTRRFGGMGLGLHVVKRLVALLGGSVACASTPGVGSTFTVTLPARTDEASRPGGGDRLH